MTRKERQRLIKAAKTAAKLKRIERGELWSHRFEVLGRILGNPIVRGLVAKKVKELR